MQFYELCGLPNSPSAAKRSWNRQKSGRCALLRCAWISAPGWMGSSATIIMCLTPMPKLKRFFGDGVSGDYIFLIDEAHNLAERGREMYSATHVLPEEDVLPKIRKYIKPYSLATRLWDGLPDSFLK